VVIAVISVVTEINGKLDEVTMRWPTFRRRSALNLISGLVLLLLGVVFAIRSHLPPWLFMWLLALVMFANCKWASLRKAVLEDVPLSWPAALEYLVAWVGMEPREFVKRPGSVGPVECVRIQFEVFYL